MRAGRLRTWAITAAAVACWAAPALAAVIPVPNGSFESPATEFVDTRVDSWQKTPKPSWWDEQAYGPWDNLVGVFANVAPEDPRHIDNCDGRQAVWVFANPGVGMFQELDARFEVGRFYQLSVGLFPGWAYPMAPGATVVLSLYYRDAASNQVAVASVTVTNTASVFTNGVHHLVDFDVAAPVVRASDPWAGQRIGIAIMSAVFEPAGGYWVLDNVRLTEIRPPSLSATRATNGWVSLRVDGEPGTTLELLASSDLAHPPDQWSSLGLVTNQAGSVWFVERVTNALPRFYRARQWP